MALQTVRERLREGAFGFERRLAATEIAAQLALSATPVREALARLAGEGLVEDRRGQGYFVRRPSATDVADLYRLSQAQLLIALDPRRVHGPVRAAALPASDPLGGAAEALLDPVTRVERLFDAWVGEGGSWALLEAHGRVQARLGPVRRHESLVIDDLEAEANALAALAGAADRSRRVAAIRMFHRRRVRSAERLAGLLESRPQAPRY